MNNNYPYHAIEICGAKQNIFVLKKVMISGTTPVDCIRYKTECKAREAANKMGIEIKKIGGHYDII